MINLQGMHLVSIAIWSRVLDTIAKTHETFKYLPSSVHSIRSVLGISNKQQWEEHMVGR